MSADPSGPEQRPDYSAGLPDYHDPTAGFGGAPPAQSALTLRLALATFGLLFCVAFAVVFAVVTHLFWATMVLALLALVAAVDVGVILARKRRGEPG